MNTPEGFPVELCPPHYIDHQLDNTHRDIWITDVSEQIYRRWIFC